MRWTSSASCAAAASTELGAVKTFYMAGSPIPREVAQAFLDRGVTPQNVYGMSENSSHQYTLPSDRPETIVATCGRACRAYEIRLWDQENPDIEVAPGEIGEIGGRGACLMLGYFDNQQRDRGVASTARGWFMSGDLGRFDAAGCLEIVGRKKDLIIRGGRNIHPAKIEDLAMRHRAVARAAAFAGRRPAARREGLPVGDLSRRAQSAEARGIACASAHAEGLSRYDMPEYFIAMTAYPLTASGKVLKRELVEWARAGRISRRRCAGPGNNGRLTMFEYQLEHIMSYTAKLGVRERIGHVPAEGFRVNVEVTGGEVTGPRVFGKLSPRGGDWLAVRRDGVVLLDVRATIETNDGALIYMTYTGMSDLGEGGYDQFAGGGRPAQGMPIRISPRFHAAHPDYVWLNRLFCLGIGQSFPERAEVAYDIYAVR